MAAATSAGAAAKKVPTKKVLGKDAALIRHGPFKKAR